VADGAGDPFGAVLRRQRKAARLTQEELAQRAAVSVRTISYLESGKVASPHQQTVQLLADALDLTGPDRAAFLRAARLGPQWTAPEVTPAVGAPAQLPSDVYAFTGRDEELRRLDELAGADRIGSGTVVISAIAGMAGVGKTALAVHWAHRVADRYPDGQLYVDLRGYDSAAPLPPGDALAGILRTLGTPSDRIPFELPERAALYRTLLAGRRMLLLLDNVSQVDQARWLLPGTASCQVLVTSRDSLGGLVVRHGARRLTLDLLPPDDAVALLRTLIGDQVDADPAGARALAECCARLPLALRIAAELAATRPADSLADLAAELGGERRLDALDEVGDDHVSVRAVFSWSYRSLTPPAARMFVLLGQHPGPSFDRYAAVALADTDTVTDTDTDTDGAGRLLGVLSRAHLVEPVDAGRWRLHDLLRAYAIDLTTGWRRPDVRAARTRLVDYYRYAAVTAAGTVYPHVARADKPEPGTPVPDLTDPAAAKAWLDAEQATLLTVTRFALRHELHGQAIDLAEAAARHFLATGQLDEALVVRSLGLDAARKIGDRHREAGTLSAIGGIYWRWGQFEPALEHLEGCRALYHEIGDRGGEGKALNNLSVICQGQGRFDRSAEYLAQAVPLYQEAGDREGEGSALNNLGLVDRWRGRYPQATVYFGQALDCFQDTGDRSGQALVLNNLGIIYHRQGRTELAIAHVERAIAVCRAGGEKGCEAIALDSLGAAYLAAGRADDARRTLEQALDLAREVGYRTSAVDSLVNLAGVHDMQGRPDDAVRTLREALAEAEEIGYVEGRTAAHNGLGETLAGLGQADAARAAHQAALTLAVSSGDLYEQARAHDGLARALEAVGQPADAETHARQARQIFAELGLSR
jgi:tetratricopeptide (TPR) repeat protein/transcriptional regulator with XRE-family HTH domain